MKRKSRVTFRVGSTGAGKSIGALEAVKMYVCPSCEGERTSERVRLYVAPADHSRFPGSRVGHYECRACGCAWVLFGDLS
jgi:hypothetical protein